MNGNENTCEIAGRVEHLSRELEALLLALSDLVSV